MQRVEFYRSKKFFSGEVSQHEVNLHIQAKNAEGWRVVAVTPLTTLFGLIGGLVFLLENDSSV